MTIEAGLLAFLKTQAPLTARVGARVYFLGAPQKIDPAAGDYVTFSKLTGGRHRQLDFAVPLFQVSYWSKDRWKAVDGAEVLIAALKGYSGDMGTVYVSHGGYRNDTVIKAGSAYQAPVDFQISHREG